jgi:1-deoxy-D-xylulose-5-phosphate reductoisomerase
MNRRLIILGSTGSIGTQALEVVEHLNALHDRGGFPVRHEVVGLAAGRNAELLNQQAQRFRVKHTAIAQAEGPRAFKSAEELVRQVPCDIVLAAMVGSAGLPATLAAVELGRDIALANKETLVAAGSLIVPAAQRSGSKLLPVDSEHAALWQCLGCEAAPPSKPSAAVARAILTASGGPFRTWTKAQIADAKPEQALKHPTWTMGRKVTIDSASLMNKALEIIEAHWLFGIPASRLEALVHPQSLIHAMAEFVDGSVVAQLAPPDMRAPIQHALAWPHCADGVSRRMDWTKAVSLELTPIDHDRFPLMKLGHRAIELGGTAGAILSAANEAAVAAFLEQGFSFGRMQEAILQAVESIKPTPMKCLDDCLAAESLAREAVLKFLLI